MSDIKNEKKQDINYIKYDILHPYSSVYIYLKQHGFSENYIKNLRKTWGNIVVNGEIVNIRKPLFSGDVLQINDNPNTKSCIMRCILGLDIVYEDAYYLAVNKPSGLVTTPTRSHYTENLAGAVCNYMDKKTNNFVLRVMNRLDKDACGIVLIAKSSIAQKELCKIDKTYHALCVGKIDKDMVIDKKIATISNDMNIHLPKRVISQSGKEATTLVYPLAYSQKLDMTLVKVNIIHGRTHQIRLHLSSENHPLVGDEIYGEKSNLISHTALICKEMAFFHPFLKTNISLEVDYPDDFKHLLAQFGENV